MPPRAIIPCLMMAALTADASAQTPVEVGPKIAVTTATTSRKTHTVLATDARGNFVVVWEAYTSGGGSNIWARQFDVNGRPRGPEFRVNSGTSRNWRADPSVASDPSGGFVVAWSGYEEGYLSSREIFGRRFDASAMPLGADFRINAHTTWQQNQPSVALHSSGAFVVAWQGAGPGNLQDNDVMARVFDATGTPLGPEFLANAYTTSSQSEPSLGMDAEGRFVIVWYSYGQDGQGTGIFGQRFDAGGARIGLEFQVNTYTTGHQREVSVARRPDGAFMVAWNNRNAYRASRDHVWEIEGRTFDADGNATGAAFHVNTHTTGLQYFPEVAVDGEEGFVVKWSNGPNGILCIPEDPCPPPPPPSEYFGRARRFDAQGRPFGSEFEVATCATGRCEHAWDIVGTRDGYFVVAGTALRQTEVFAQRYGPEHIFADGFESQSLAAWSGVRTTAGELNVSHEAALGGTEWGLEGRVQAPGSLFVQDDSPRAEKAYRARFLFDPRDFDAGETEAHYRTRVLILLAESPNRRVATVVLRRRGGEHALMARARLDDDTQVDTRFVPVTGTPHAVEIEWRRATDAESADGFVRLWVDGSLVGEAAGLDNSRAVVDSVRLGVLAVKAGGTGTLSWDEFGSDRGTGAVLTGHR